MAGLRRLSLKIYLILYNIIINKHTNNIYKEIKKLLLGKLNVSNI